MGLSLPSLLHLAIGIGVILCVTIRSVHPQHFIPNVECIIMAKPSDLPASISQSPSNCASSCTTTYVGLQQKMGCYCLNTIPTQADGTPICIACRDRGAYACGNSTDNTMYMYAGCRRGKFGSDCTQDCHCANSRAICSRNMGLCDGGCAAGYSGTPCTTGSNITPTPTPAPTPTPTPIPAPACTPPMYGENCAFTCTNCNACDPKDGCTQCAAGYQSLPACKTPCTAPMFGENCASTCSNCKQCDSVNGCSQCAAGYQTPPACTTTCTPPMFGENCTSTCKNCKECDPVNGCRQCAAGYQTPPACTTTCTPPMFGENCASTCRNCRDNAHCHHILGCTECAAGHQYTPDCSTSCTPPTFGENCVSTCTNCKECDPVNGCIQCSAGYQIPPACTTPCTSPMFGENCASACISCRDNKPCHHIHGCSECPAGFLSTPGCNIHCTPPMYGENCAYTCINCRDNAYCHHINGCSQCAAGYQPPPACNTLCTYPMFGENCASTCTNCKHCDPVHGCRQCAAGYQIPPACVTFCTPPMFGENCAFTCTNCKQCDPVNGCRQCAAGYQSPPACTTLGMSSSARTDKKNPGIIGPVMGAVVGIFVLIVIIVVIIVFLKRRRAKKKDTLGDNGVNATNGNLKSGGENAKSVKQRPDSLLSGTVPSGHEMVPEAPEDHSLAVSELEAHIKKTREEETHPFKTEYESIPAGQTSSWKFGIQPSIHKLKNRFANIIPYDHNRVQLERANDDVSEYINASYIHGYKEPNSFIATQGPLSETVADFWRMCWKKDSHVIIMVTNLIENKKVKSEKYWPDFRKRKTIEEFSVHTFQEEQFADFIIRGINLTKGNETRRITHFQFTGWPDHGVPRQATPLLTLRRRVRAKMVPTAGPTIIHCSAGVGRTGTYLALDYLKNQAEKEGIIDVFKCVWGMRYQRVNMVQTWDQYNFIYNALLESVTVGETTIPCDKFSEIYPEWLKRDQTTNVTKLEQQLRILDVVKQKYLPMELKPARTPVNQAKNRTQEIIPADDNRPELRTKVPGTNDYINAVFVQGCYYPDAFLVTQVPLPDTRVDFWRMVYENESHSIICLHDYELTDHEENISEEQDEDQDVAEDDKKATAQAVLPLWPKEGTMTFGPISIAFLKVSIDKQGITSIELTLSMGKKDKTGHHVTVFTPTKFPAKEDEPITVKQQMGLKKAVTKNQQRNGNKTVVVLCKYGVDRCGVYCALDYVIDMMELEQEVDVFQAVRQVQMPRPQFIKNIQQYSFLYDAAKTYMEMDMNYANLQSIPNSNGIQIEQEEGLYVQAVDQFAATD